MGCGSEGGGPPDGSFGIRRGDVSACWFSGLSTRYAHLTRTRPDFMEHEGFTALSDDSTAQPSMIFDFVNQISSIKSGRFLFRSA